MDLGVGVNPNNNYPNESQRIRSFE